MIPNTSDTIHNSEHNFIFAHRAQCTTIVFIRPPDKWDFLQWVTSAYCHVLTDNADYTPADFANLIEKSYSVDEPHNAAAIAFLRRLENVRPFEG